MEVTTPKDMSSGISQVESVIAKFELGLRDEEKDQNYYHIVITGEYSREVCDEVENTYKKAGWTTVKCRTSSENGEKPGLTGLVLYYSN